MADELTLRKRIEQAILSVDSHEAFDLVKELEAVEESMDQTKRGQVDQLLKLKAQLQFIALRYYEEGTVLDLMKKDLAAILTLPQYIDPIDLFKSRLLNEEELADRDKLRSKFRDAIERSEAVFGKEKIKLGDNLVRPTIQNWMKVYISEVGNKRVSSVALARFFTKNEAMSHLSRENQQALRRLFDLYEFLKLSSADVSGNEDVLIVDDPDLGFIVVADGGAYDVYNESMIERLKEQGENQELSFDELVDLRQRFPGQFDKYLPRGMNPSDARGDMSFDPVIVQQRLGDFLQKQKQTHNVSITTQMPQNASLFTDLQHALGKQDQFLNGSQLKHELADLVIDRVAFSSFMRKSEVVNLVLNNFPDELGQKNKEALQASVLSPLGFQALLLIVFKDIYRLTEEEALWHSYQIIERFTLELKDFKTIVTYDVSQNKLVWRY